jgi:hypothetical protein
MLCFAADTYRLGRLLWPRDERLSNNRAPRQSQTNRRFQRRWLELTGEQFRPRVGVHPGPGLQLIIVSICTDEASKNHKNALAASRSGRVRTKTRGKRLRPKGGDRGVVFLQAQWCVHWPSCRAQGSQCCRIEAMQRDTSLSKPVSLQLRAQKGTWVLHLHSNPGGRLPHARYRRMELLLLL